MLRFFSRLLANRKDLQPNIDLPRPSKVLESPQNEETKREPQFALFSIRQELDKILLEEHKEILGKGYRFWSGMLQWALQQDIFNQEELKSLRIIKGMTLHSGVLNDTELYLAKKIILLIRNLSINEKRISKMGEDAIFHENFATIESYIQLKNLDEDQRVLLKKHIYQNSSIEDCNTLAELFETFDKGERYHPSLTYYAEYLHKMRSSQ